MRHPTAANSGTAGFALLEVLVALSIVAVALTSIGALMATTTRAARSIEARVMRFEIARSTMTAIPNRNQLAPGHFSGETFGHPWRLEVKPFAIDDQRLPGRPSWTPQMVTVTVQSPAGAALELRTVRLRRSNGG